MAGLDIQRIAGASLEIVDQRGPEGLTIRAVAERLGVTPMALYHHVENKAALLALVVETALSEQPLPVHEGKEWKEDLWREAKWVYDTMSAHPAVALLRIQYNVWTPRALTLGERWSKLWLRSGLSDRAASQAALANPRAVVGLAHQEILTRDRQPPNEPRPSWVPKLGFLFESDLAPAAGSNWSSVC